jgi:hypothetical protein
MIFESHATKSIAVQAVDEIQQSLSSASLSSDQQQSGNRANSTIQITLARPEDVFCNILLMNHTSPIEPDSTATSADPSSSSLSSTGTPSRELDDLDDDHLSEEDELHRKKDEWKMRK